MGERLLVVLAGLPGAGKSTLSRTVCEVLEACTGTPATALSTDDTIRIQCADALLPGAGAAGLPYSLSGDGFVFEPAARERLSVRAVAGLAQLLTLWGSLVPVHLVAELPSRWAPVFLQAGVRAGLTAGYDVFGVELVADPATCEQRNRRRPQQLPADAVQHMAHPGVGAGRVWGPLGEQVLSSFISVSTEGPLEVVRQDLAERCAALLASTTTIRR